MLCVLYVGKKKLCILFERIFNWRVGIVNIVCNVHRRTMHVLYASQISFERMTLTGVSTVRLIDMVSQSWTQMELMARNNAQIRISFESLLCLVWKTIVQAAFWCKVSCRAIYGKQWTTCSMDGRKRWKGKCLACRCCTMDLWNSVVGVMVVREKYNISTRMGRR